MRNSSDTSGEAVAVVTTGGTIGSILSDSVRAVDTDSATIAERISEHCAELNIDLEIVPAMNMLSENMEPTDWAEVGSNIQDCLDAGYENIVVTHGTDTMVYSSNAFRNALPAIEGRVIFTGSFYGPDVPDSDVEIALRSSLEASIDRSLDKDAYICFRSPDTDDRAHLHRAVDTRPMQMDGTGFRSLFDDIVGEYTPTAGWEWTGVDSPTANADHHGVGGIPDETAYADVLGDIELVNAIPGQVLDPDETDPEVLVVSLYHSGTASLSTHENGLREFIRTRSDETDVYLVGLSTDLVPTPYESTAKLIQDGAELVTDVQPHVVYTAMYVGLANGLSTDEIMQQSPGQLSDGEES